MKPSANTRARRVRSLFIVLPLFCTARVIEAAEYTTFIGDANPYQIVRVAADLAGNTYIAGTRLFDQASDVFVMKLDPAGRTLWFQDISGKGSDTAADIAIDTAGNIYLGGSTSSVSFPVVNALQSTPGPGFLVKLNADGSRVWSTYFRAAIRALAVDASGNVYLTGATFDPEFPVTTGLPNGFVNNAPGASGSVFYQDFSSGRSPRLLRYRYREGAGLWQRERLYRKFE
jgi:hypothetical protein